MGPGGQHCFGEVALLEGAIVYTLTKKVGFFFFLLYEKIQIPNYLNYKSNYLFPLYSEMSLLSWFEKIFLPQPTNILFVH
jgi:hypothetical protein